jgi:hypothetical protein
MDIYFAPQTKMKSKWTEGGSGTILFARWSIYVWFQNNIHGRRKKKKWGTNPVLPVQKKDAGVWYLLAFGMRL